MMMMSRALLSLLEVVITQKREPILFVPGLLLHSQWFGNTINQIPPSGTTVREEVCFTASGFSVVVVCKSGCCVRVEKTVFDCHEAKLKNAHHKIRKMPS